MSAVKLQDLNNLPAHPHAGAQGGGRVLRNETDAVTPQSVEGGAIELLQVIARKQDTAGFDSTVLAPISQELVSER